ncbi:transposase [Streptomyces sp. NPDC020719]|uniref:transposase n=1 Tax=Streptomyces sp. NPDC020719 TaxID=3154896 RepID=UPI00340385F7
MDTAASTATCPNGHTAQLSGIQSDGSRVATFTTVCPACPLRHWCTHARRGRQVRVPHGHEAQAAARYQAATDRLWQDEYRRWRPMVERGIAWLTTRGNRRLRYRGTLKRQDQPPAGCPRLATPTPKIPETRRSSSYSTVHHHAPNTDHQSQDLRL